MYKKKIYFLLLPYPPKHIQYILLLLAVILVSRLLSAPVLKMPHQPATGPSLSTSRATVTVDGTRWGQSTCSIGAVEGSGRFDITDLQDLGIINYRIYGGMSRWEPQDDSAVYGTLTIDQIKANPNAINWAQWDQIMTYPPGGSDYGWAPENPRWQGSARTLFDSLKYAGIRPLLVLRNRDDHSLPGWAPDPPVTQADWNEWWKYVFALVYWLDVRNDYNVNDFEMHNEPDQVSQGWYGTIDQYMTYIQYTRDAIDYVYKTYLPGRSYHLYAPVTSSWSQWPSTILKKDTSFAFDSVDIHDYDADITKYVTQVHQSMNATGHASDPLWLTEWGNYSPVDRYDEVSFGISLINNLIRQSSSGSTYVYGSDLFTLYDFGSTIFGLIKANGQRRLDYYAMRLAIRALQGCLPTYRSYTSNADLLAITTQHANGDFSFLVTNQSKKTAYNIRADLSKVLRMGQGTLRRFDAFNRDTITDTTPIKSGQAMFTLPPNGAVLLTISTSCSIT